MPRKSEGARRAEPSPLARLVPVQRRSRDRFELILATAADILTEKGSEAFRMSDIVERTGVAFGSLYQYFPDKTAIIGTLAVVAFMIIYYFFAGLVADIALLFNVVISLGVMCAIGTTLTLPGIAGIMLSTGSALDANILVFERLKEELRGGRVLKQAFDQAWSRAWPSIRDSNIAALITSAILFWFGNTFGATIVKGFSLTLAIGVLISLFSSLYITRTLLALALDWFKPKNLERWFGI